MGFNGPPPGPQFVPRNSDGSSALSGFVSLGLQALVEEVGIPLCPQFPGKKCVWGNGMGWEMVNRVMEGPGNVQGS